MIFVTCCFFNQAFKIVQGTKIFHSFITHWSIEVTYEYKVTNFFAFITDKIQIV